MVLDSSAVLAILLDEKEAMEFATIIADNPPSLLSAGSLVEVSSETDLSS